MKLHPQTIYRDDQPEFIILPFAEYQQLIASLEDYTDIQEIKEHIASKAETFPMSVVKALAQGENPIKAYRKHRGISQASLAAKANVSKQYISQLENGERDGTNRVLKAIARALKVDLEDIA
ncbi:helix-turn-helix transcriptional regulator [Candidatus Babeliales bacterium]|nr:helix-turn-helix transcriptional regulator [Candidatus Babeliales bacterium]